MFYGFVKGYITQKHTNYFKGVLRQREQQLTSFVLQMDAKVIPQAFPGIAFQGSSPKVKLVSLMWNEVQYISNVKIVLKRK